MATFQRHVDVNWQGGLMDGKGEAKAGTGAFTLPVTFGSRIQDPAGRTSPEELMAAAHAACYAMALNATLGAKHASAERTDVTATISADLGTGNPVVPLVGHRARTEGDRGVAVRGRGAGGGTGLPGQQRLPGLDADHAGREGRLRPCCYRGNTERTASSCSRFCPRC
jgi:organic hydroperoxide reductase OsmC/OhrA